NYAKFVETPIPLDLNVRAGSENSQTDKNFNVDRLNAVSGSNIVPGISSTATVGAVNLGADPTPIDGNLRPQTVNETTLAFEYEIDKMPTTGAGGICGARGDVSEDGSFDDGDHSFLSTRGRRYPGSTEDKACSDPAMGCFGHARRYYRAVEFTATKRFS